LNCAVSRAFTHFAGEAFLEWDAAWWRDRLCVIASGGKVVLSNQLMPAWSRTT